MNKQKAAYPQIAGKVPEQNDVNQEESYFRPSLESITNNSTVALFITDERQHCTFMNPAAEKLTGYTFAELQNQPFHNVVHHTRPDGGHYPLEECPINNAFSQNNQAQGEEVFVRKDGTFYRVAFAASPFREEGKFVGTILEVRDITKEKEYDESLLQIAEEKEKLFIAETEAREESETLRHIGQLLAGELDLQKVVQAVTDAATTLIGAQFGAFFYNVVDEKGESMMLYTLSGVSREAFANIPMPSATDMFGPTFRGEGTVRIDNVKDDPRFGNNKPYYGLPKGHLPVVSYLAVSVISRSGEVIGGLFFGHEKEAVFSAKDERIVEGLAAQAAIAMDNARLFETAQREKKKAQTAASENERLFIEAQESSRMKDDFLAIVSHELRTPLTAILGWTNLLLSQNLDVDSHKRALETIDRNARAQAEIIEDILDISRIITGKLRLDMRLVNPVEIIESTVESAVPAAEAKEIKLTTLLDSSAGPVYGDSNRLQQIFWNLISNALKFTPKKGKVQVRLERVNSHIEISIIDNGQGISEEFLPYVFDRFRQADSSTSRTSGGLGVGLSIVRQLIELHGGSVSVASSGEGQGSAFTVILPQAAVQTKSSTNNHQSVHPRVNEIYVPFECAPQLKDISVLIVDDEKDARELLTAILEQCGAVVYQAANITEAIQQLEKNNPDILVSDIGMPDKDGFELIKQVREKENLEKGKRIPAVALTAYARVEDRMRTLSAGFQMHVSKPVEPAELVAVIANLTEWKM